jgi:hypothetical protein
MKPNVANTKASLERRYCARGGVLAGGMRALKFSPVHIIPKSSVRHQPATALRQRFCLLHHHHTPAVHRQRLSTASPPPDADHGGFPQFHWSEFIGPNNPGNTSWPVGKELGTRQR